MYQVEIDRMYANLLEDALTRLAAGMGIDEGEEPECDDKADRERCCCVAVQKGLDQTYYDTNSGY